MRIDIQLDTQELPSRDALEHLVALLASTRQAASAQTASATPGFSTSWLDQACVIDTPRVRELGYTWRDMLAGSPNGFRVKILEWAIRRKDLHDPLIRYQASVCLFEGYGLLPFAPNGATVEPGPSTLEERLKASLGKSARVL